MPRITVEAFSRVYHDPIRLKVSELIKSSDSEYKHDCPVCMVGLLPMQRDEKTFKLLNTDRCLYCGQAVIYTDLGGLV